MGIIPISDSQGARWVTKTVTFTGAAGTGAVGTVSVFTVTGRVLVHVIAPYCTTNLTEAGATASVALGTTNQTQRFVATTTSTAIDVDEWWTTSTPTLGSVDLPSASSGTNDMASVLVAENVIITCTGQATNAGVIAFYCLWEPLSAGATLVAA